MWVMMHLHEAGKLPPPPPLPVKAEGTEGTPMEMDEGGEKDRPTASDLWATLSQELEVKSIYDMCENLVVSQVRKSEHWLLRHSTV